MLTVCMVQLHIVKNWLVDNGWLDHTIRVPLILGIWGGKGQGVLPPSRHCLNTVHASAICHC